MKSLSVVLAVLFFSVIALAESSPDSKTPEMASMTPALNLLPKTDVFKFIKCESENECYRNLQELNLETKDAQTHKEYSFVAEFVQSPEKGLKVYRKERPQN